MRSMIAQAAAWILGPALATLFIVALMHAITTYQPEVTGHAMQAPAAECVTSPDEFFNDCAVLDTSEVQDLRTGWDEKLCDTTHCWTEHHTDSTELEIP